MRFPSRDDIRSGTPMGAHSRSSAGSGPRSSNTLKRFPNRDDLRTCLVPPLECVLRFEDGPAQCALTQRQDVGGRRHELFPQQY